MTPMQILKPQFDEFKSLIKGFKELSLNKSEPKVFVSQFCGDRTVHENRGVQADFIKLFKMKYNKEDSFSIGFEFKYIGLSDSDSRINVSIKNGEESYFLSDYLSIDQFKEKFIFLINELKQSKGLDTQKIIDVVTNGFNLIPSQAKNKIRRKNK